MKPHPRAGRPPMRLGLLLALAAALVLAAGAAWFAFHPRDLGALAAWVWKTRPVVQSLTVSLNGEETILRPGQTVKMHPSDTLALVSLESDRWFNYNLRLYSPELDVETLRQPVSLWTLFGEDAFDQPRLILIQVKEGPQVLAEFRFLAALTAPDWAAKADRASRIEDKIAYLRKALALEPRNQGLREKLADLLVEAGQHLAAAAIYEETIQERPELSVLKKLLAIYHAAKDDDHLELTYRRLVQVAPEAEAAAYLRELARFLEKRGELEGAIESYQAFRARSKGEPEARVLKRLGYLYARTKSLDKAIEAYEAAAKLDPTDAAVFYNLARLYQTQGQETRYRDRLARAVELEPTNLSARLDLADSYTAAGKNQRAEEELKGIIAQDPEYVEARLRLIKLLEAQDKSEALVEQYEFFLDRAPKNKVLRYNLGVIYFESGRLERAEKMMREVLRLDPGDAEAKDYLFEICRRQKKDQEAYALAQDLIRRKPDLEAAYDFIFDYLDRGQEYKTLAEAAQRWVTQRPNVPRFREYLAYAQIKQDHLQDAARTYESLLELKADDLETMFKLAKLYEADRNLALALKTYDRILKADPHNEQAAEARLRLSLERLESKHGR